MRFSLAYVSFKDRKAVAADLKAIYGAATADEAGLRLKEFAEKWDTRYASMAKLWHSNWARITPMFGLPGDIQRAVYITNATESLNISFRKLMKTRASFPNDYAAFKLLYLALRNAAEKWMMPIKHWSGAMRFLDVL